MRLIIFTLILIIGWHGFAQQDSVLLDEITIDAFAFTPFATGSKLQYINYEGNQSFDALLSSQQAIYFKSYGNHQLATISFRGTSASHTNVLWHGMPVNSPTLGQTDFSTWSAWLADDMAVLAGSSGAMFGSGSIGGTVFVDHFNRTNPPYLAQAKLTFGSFGENFQGVKTYYDAGNFSGSTKIFRSAIVNDFDYPLKGRDEIQTQKNAGSKNYGLKQSLQWHGDQQRFSSDFMFSYLNREVQPSIANNEAEDQLSLANYRLAFEHLIDVKSATVTSTLGWVQDNMIYNENDPIKANQLSINQRYENTFKKFSFSTGYLIQSAFATSANYDEQVSQTYMDLIALTKYDLSASMLLSLSLRQSFFEDGVHPFVPSIGLSKEWKRSGSNRYMVEGRVSRGFRYPTLNDRYWNPGGNVNLNPEKTVNGELSASFESKNFKMSITGFGISAKDWIQWMPNEEGIWSPSNLQDVKVYGAESTISYSSKWTSALFSSKAVANFQRSINQSAFPTEAEIGKQLPYTPFITCSWINDLNVNNMGLSIHQSYTGKRFTTLDNSEFQSVDGFYLLDLSASYQTTISSFTINTEFAVNNVLNHYYENLKNRAMPGINYQLHLTITI